MYDDILKAFGCVKFGIKNVCMLPSKSRAKFIVEKLFLKTLEENPLEHCVFLAIVENQFLKSNLSNLSFDYNYIVNQCCLITRKNLKYNPHVKPIRIEIDPYVKPIRIEIETGMYYDTCCMCGNKC